jgi:DNA replication and repair protein RecF
MLGGGARLMQIDRLWLTDFRCYEQLELSFAPGLTAIVGANGQGKTNILEAIGWLATLDSFRGAPAEALIRDGAAQAIVRGEAQREQRALLLEAELLAHGRNRAQLNHQPLRRARDLLGALRVSVFAPDDLVLVKGGPSQRRHFLDETLVATAPKHDALRSDLERVLRQRNALLKQAGGRLRDDVAVTLDVWDDKLVQAGEALAAAREGLVEVLRPALADAYRSVARREAPVGLAYVAPWRSHPAGLRGALLDARADDARRGVTTIGPHRDDLEVRLAGLPARTHASQGEQRSLALALRLGAHAVVTVAAGASPVLLLDDVFSELDPQRSDALLHSLPPGQTLLTTAAVIPPGAHPELTLRVQDRQVEQR